VKWLFLGKATCLVPRSAVSPLSLSKGGAKEAGNSTYKFISELTGNQDSYALILNLPLWNIVASLIPVGLVPLIPILGRLGTLVSPSLSGKSISSVFRPKMKLLCRWKTQRTIGISGRGKQTKPHWNINEAPYTLEHLHSATYWTHLRSRIAAFKSGLWIFCPTNFSNPYKNFAQNRLMRTWFNEHFMISYRIIVLIFLLFFELAECTFIRIIIFFVRAKYDR